MKCLRVRVVLMRISIIVISIVILLGCTPREGSIAWHNKMPHSKKLAYFQKICIGYGYKRGTEEMRDCTAAEMRTSKASAKQEQAAYAAQIIFGK